MTVRPLIAPLLVALALPVAAAAAATKTIRVTSVTVSMISHDVKPNGASKGDTITYRDTLVNATTQFGRRKGAVVGSDSGKMTFTSAHTAVFQGKAILPGGTLILSGAVYTTAAGLVVPVTGGTGAYAGMHGTLTVGSGKTRVPNTYRLTVAAGPVA
jgi:hypothetical protein